VSFFTLVPCDTSSSALRSILHMGDSAKSASDSGKSEKKTHVPWTEDELAALHEGVAKCVVHHANMRMPTWLSCVKIAC
jgi:hypothetical protein